MRSSSLPDSEFLTNSYFYMDISILCSDENHPVNEYLEAWVHKHERKHEISILRNCGELEKGDLLFLISCNEIVRFEDRKKFRKALVIHASELPKGRGWSPHIWQILEGHNRVIVTLLEAEDKVDSGDICEQLGLEISRNALWDEINDLLFDAECRLMDFAVENFDAVVPTPQISTIEPTYYPKRTPADSEIDPERSLADQFDQIRVCDPDRFPAFFKLRGDCYTIKLEKCDGRN